MQAYVRPGKARLEFLRLHFFWKNSNPNAPSKPIPKFSPKTYDFVGMTRVIKPLRHGGCFLGDGLVLLPNAVHKRVDKLCEGDLVVTELGNHRAIKEVLKKKNRTLYNQRDLFIARCSG
eukprot:TRINITY_DN2551_c0_g1_i1.p1 TRINITY_DN2551_c0_g1~~TRINITY_DN2551_c0_g1_i1.p1  ORF type:complete len:119 (+),score=13.14 TRINITY_DN2551_c0_g1_i1:256-612(+)